MMQHQNAAKYKSALCKHYDTPKGCSYKEKCQFAHGAHELKSNMNMLFAGQPNMIPSISEKHSGNQSKKTPNPSNFKIVKCKNYEAGNCKYGNTCTFAHGDVELRSKTQNAVNTLLPSQQMSMLNNFMPMYYPAMDPSMFMGMPMTNPADINLGMIPNMMDPSLASVVGVANPMDFSMGMNMNMFPGMFAGISSANLQNQKN